MSIEVMMERAKNHVSLYQGRMAGKGASWVGREALASSLEGVEVSSLGGVWTSSKAGALVKSLSSTVGVDCTGGNSSKLGTFEVTAVGEETTGALVTPCVVRIAVSRASLNSLHVW